MREDDVVMRASRSTAGIQATIDAGSDPVEIIILVGGSSAKKQLFEQHLKSLNISGIYIMHVPSNMVLISSGPVVALESSLKNILDRFVVRAIIPLIDSVVPCVDKVSADHGLPGNSPETSLSRCDKAIMQSTLKDAHVEYINSHRSNSLELALDIWRREFSSNSIVVKPPRSGGSEGVRVCFDEEDITAHFSSFLGKHNLEGIQNSELVLQEFLSDYNTEFIVNTVSLEGEHFVTDIWESLSKACGSGAVSSERCFIYSNQHLVLPQDPRVPKILEYVYSVLEALCMKTGASHLEIAGRVDNAIGAINNLVLIEINPRVAGEIRTSNGMIYEWTNFDQIYWYLMSITEPERFHHSISPYNIRSSIVYQPIEHVIAVFLRNSGNLRRLNAKILWRIRSELKSFSRFGRGLTWMNGMSSLDEVVANRKKLFVSRTVDLLTSPGVVLLVGESALHDMEIIRIFESQSLYI